MAGRGQGNRRVPTCPVKLDGGIDIPNVDQAANAQLEALKAFAVGSQRGVVVRAGRQVPVVGGRECLAGRGVEIEHIDRFVNRRDGFTRLGRFGTAFIGGRK